MGHTEGMIEVVLVESEPDLVAVTCDPMARKLTLGQPRVLEHFGRGKNRVSLALAPREAHRGDIWPSFAPHPCNDSGVHA
jgi:hypothetical protein